MSCSTSKLKTFQPATSVRVIWCSRTQVKPVHTHSNHVALAVYVRTSVSLSLTVDIYSADLLTRPRPVQINSWLWCERFSPSIGSRSQKFWFSTESTGPAAPTPPRWPATPRESSSCCPPRRRPPKRSARPASVSRLARLKIFAHGSHMTTCCFCYCWKMGTLRLKLELVELLDKEFNKKKILMLPGRQARHVG